MFKDLRTKIELEQKGQVLGKAVSHNSTQGKASTDTDREIIAGNPHLKQNSSHTAPKESEIISENNFRSKDVELTNITTESDSRLETVEPRSLENLIEINKKLSNLEEQLTSVIKERDESAEQNAQLYQIIEKLRRSLDSEKDINSNLQSKVNELEAMLGEKDNLIVDLSSSSIAKSMRSFASKEKISDEPQTLVHLLQKVDELQNQLSEKTRQLRVTNQNTNDIRKALQREITDHSKTKEELKKIQEQLNQANSENISANNGLTPSDTDATLRYNHDAQNGMHQEESQSMTIIDKDDSALVPQLDRMSNLSSSSASVDNLDPNDLQTNHYKEVNQEYLRNVLFRYMTTNDVVTAQHLVKAITVMMKFSPEQSAAIKTAMSLRSSWLRLK